MFLSNVIHLWREYLKILPVDCLTGSALKVCGVSITLWNLLCSTDRDVNCLLITVFTVDKACRYIWLMQCFLLICHKMLWLEAQREFIATEELVFSCLHHVGLFLHKNSNDLNKKFVLQIIKRSHIKMGQCMHRGKLLLPWHSRWPPGAKIGSGWQFV